MYDLNSSVFHYVFVYKSTDFAPKKLRPLWICKNFFLNSDENFPTKRPDISSGRSEFCWKEEEYLCIPYHPNNGELLLSPMFMFNLSHAKVKFGWLLHLLQAVGFFLIHSFLFFAKFDTSFVKFLLKRFHKLTKACCKENQPQVQFQKIEGKEQGKCYHESKHM